MKHLKILLILIGAILFNGCATTVAVHVPNKIPTNCNFEKFPALTSYKSLTDKELSELSELVTNKLKAVDLMVEATGKTIFRNQTSCNLRQDRINAIISAHNRLHK